ncbi:MAG: GntR family transcriptional regulator [Kiloniellales bacterium]|nr:GntR family transcriptional regulator [Kiloniellales bacterium]
MSDVGEQLTRRQKEIAGSKQRGRSVRPSQAEHAYTEIKRRILDNDMPAGFQALEQELAESLRMSRTPVREALIRLANEGMVEIRPRHGMRVLPVSPDDMREIYEVLTSLEATAAALAAARGVTGPELAALKAAVEDMERALEDDDLRRWAEADERFHMMLVDFAGNTRLRNLVNTVWEQAHRVRMATLRLRPKPLGSNKDHAAVVDAIARGDADAAHSLHRDHRIHAGEMLIDLLRSHGIKQL